MPMPAYILKRLGLALLVALAVSVIAFLLLRLSGDVAIAIAGEGARSEDIELIRRLRPRPPARWCSISTGSAHAARRLRPVALLQDRRDRPLIWTSCRPRCCSAVLSLAFALAISIPLGVLAAVYRNSWIDRLCLALAVLGQALPNFFFALLLIMLFSITLRWLPVSGSDTWQHFVMPTIALGYYARAGVHAADPRRHDRGARLRLHPHRARQGPAAAQVVFKHALRNAVVPVVALAAVQLGFLLGGSVVIETIFALDGLGYLAYQSISHKDFPVMQAIVLLLSRDLRRADARADLLNAWLDPRIRVAEDGRAASPPAQKSRQPSPRGARCAGACWPHKAAL